EYFITWDSFYGRIYGSRVTRSGTVLDPNGIFISIASGEYGYPVVAANGSDFLVVWQDGRNGAINSLDVYGARITHNGDVLDPGGFAVHAGTFDQQSPALAYGGSGRFLLAEQGFDMGA